MSKSERAEQERELKQSYSTYRQIIHELWLPKALLIGVDYLLFWQLNPKKLEAFIKAYEEEQKNYIEKTNFSAWLNGLYISHAVAAVLSDEHQYFPEPLAFFENEEDKENKAKKEAEVFGAYAMMFNKQYKEGKA